MNPDGESPRVEGDNQDVSQTGAGQVIQPDISSVNQETTQPAGVESDATTAEPFIQPAQETPAQQSEFSPQQPSLNSSSEPDQPAQSVGSSLSEANPSPQPMVGDMSEPADQTQQTAEPTQAVEQANQPGVISPPQPTEQSDAAAQPTVSSQEQPQPQQFAAQPVVPQQGASESEENPNKSYILAIVLSFFLGGLGVDRFYLGKVGTGIIKLLTGGGFVIWYFVDLVLLVIGKLRDKDDARQLEGYAKYHKPFKIGLIALIIIQVASIALLFTLLSFS